MEVTTLFNDFKSHGRTAIETASEAMNRGVDAIVVIRELRRTFGLSLKEAKLAMHGGVDPLSKPQELAIGNTVHWEGWESTTGNFYKSGIVKAIEGDEVIVEEVKKFARDGISEVPNYDGNTCKIARQYFDRSIVDRLSENEQFLKGIIGE